MLVFRKRELLSMKGKKENCISSLEKKKSNVATKYAETWVLQIQYK